MVIQEAVLDIVCGVTSRLPDTDIAEIAFAGKSNVGKSSLINALLNRKSLARTSATPGKTQTINFYRVRGKREFFLQEGAAGEKQESAVSEKQESAASEKPESAAFYLVDLPGYGYTKASVETRMSWGKMTERYLHTSKNLRAVFLLLDIRHAPSENDRMMYRWILEQGRKPVVILTKLDKIKRSQIQKQVRTVKDALEAGPETLILPFSALTKAGRDSIWKELEQLI